LVGGSRGGGGGGARGGGVACTGLCRCPAVHNPTDTDSDAVPLEFFLLSHDVGLEKLVKLFEKKLGGAGGRKFNIQVPGALLPLKGEVLCGVHVLAAAN